MKSLDEILKKAGARATYPTNTPTSSWDEGMAEDDAIPERGVDDDEDSVEPPLSPAVQPAAVHPSAPAALPSQCPICGGTGFVMPDLPVSHPDFGKAVPCRCRAHERLQKRLHTLHAVSNLDMLAHLTFSAFIAEPSHLSGDQTRNLHRAFDTCYYYAQEPEGWLLISGTFGCGKTHLAAAIANYRLAMGEPVVFMVVPDLLDHLRATFNPQSPVSYDSLFEQLRSTPLLILDDLGTQSSTPWAQEKLFQLLNYRYNARLSTVITTNQRLDELEPRLRSRLIDPNLVSHFPIIAPDFRAGKNPSQSDLSTLALHRDQRFDTFDARREGLAGEERLNLQEVMAACEHYAQTPQGWLVLAGANGCGKTHLAAAIANHLVDSHFGDVMFVVTPDLLDHLRAAFSPQSNISYDRLFDEVRKAPLLVLDDLGTESATPWAKEKLFQLLNYRYSALLPTVITTASTPDQIEPWLRTRMFDVSRCQFYGILAPGYRKQRAAATRSRRASR